MFEPLLLVNVAATLFMTGLIWFVQLVQYPGFLNVGDQDWFTYHQKHITRTGLVVIPPMLIEFCSSIWLVIAFNQLWVPNTIGLLCVILVWSSTFTIQAPLHGQLQTEPSKSKKLKLIQSNWIRTFFWSLKAGLGGYLFMEALPL